MRKVKAIHPAQASHMPGLKTWRAMPTQRIEFLDPFLFVNHHGPEQFGANNQGLPFGPHPHRGFETLTYILAGELIHQDTTGYKSRIEKGGVQWMTAGSGLLHSETSSEEFKQKGGNMELIQLWLNLPSRLKMTEPNYHGLQYDELVHFSPDEGVKVHLISGQFMNHEGPIHSITGLTMTWMEVATGKYIQLNAPDDHEILFYVVNGKGRVNEENFESRNLVVFDRSDGFIEISAENDTRILFGHGKPFDEPIAAQGPFVMNSQEELFQAFSDFQNGKLGVWED